MRSALLMHHGTWALCLATTTLTACGGGGSGSGSSSSGGSAMCEHTATGRAMPVEIILHNMGSTDLGYPAVCGAPWSIEAPSGGHAPSGIFSLLCDKVIDTCPADCDDPTQTPVPAGTDAKFTWDGVLYEPVNAAVNGCPAADSGEFCPPTCRVRVDAPPGTYTLNTYLYPAGQGAITKTATLMYPAQTKIEIVFP